tara:strand:+ start:210 stop:446 length:237 start_codon:yes stop_codon:yes gene_type:complete
MDNNKLHEGLINALSDLMDEFGRNKIDHLTLVKTLENIVNYENNLIEELKTLSNQEILNKLDFVDGEVKSIVCLQYRK